MEIELTKVLDIQVHVENRTEIVTSTSGLVKFQNSFWAVADDSIYLLKIDPDKKKTELYLKLKPESLPTDYKERKKLKPDWESLVILPEIDGEMGLLVVPSGSKENRRWGSWIRFNPRQEARHQPVDFSDVFIELEKLFPELNIEGAAVLGNSLKLFQRGNGVQGKNAIIDLELSTVVNDLKTGTRLDANSIRKITQVDLGNLDNCLLSFTDACIVQEDLYFIAVAEESNSTYEDGPYKGAILGKIDQNGHVQLKYDLNCPQKPEGLWIEPVGDKFKFWVVTDADDPAVASCLYVGTFT